MTSPVPSRFTSGVSLESSARPFGHIGIPNPLFYHQLYSDFDVFDSTATTGDWVVTATTNGTIATTAGDGGLLLFTTNSSTPVGTDVAQIQAPIAGFTLTSGKRSCFIIRLKVSNISGAALILGLTSTSTPFAATDGLYFSKASASTQINLISNNASTATTIALPATLSPALANNTFFDLAFMTTRSGNIQAWYDSQLVGFAQFQGSATTANTGPAAASTTPPSFTTANLFLTVAIQSGTTTSKTMTVDYCGAFKER